jgi:pimeloyl-ACP methyl ester carboxylesterase
MVPSDKTRTRRLVLVHGAYHGGWCWRRVTQVLASGGVDAYTPTLTGLGQRRHLLTPETALSTHIEDIVNLFEFEDLDAAVLVGHSYAGMVIAGVAEAIPERIAHLVFLDAMVPRDGEAVFDALPDIRARETHATVAGRRIGVITPPSPEYFGVEHPADIAWVDRHLTPMPSLCYAERIRLANAAAQEIPQTYLLCAAQHEGALKAATEAAYERFRSSDRNHRRLPGPHDIMVTHPEVLAEALLSLLPETP